MTNPAHLFQAADRTRNRARVIIERLQPVVDGGEFPIKRSLGEQVDAEADVFTDGHDSIRCALFFRHESEPSWTEIPMRHRENDHWVASFRVRKLGRYFYHARAWVDHFESWRRGVVKKIAANADADIDYKTGAALIARLTALEGSLAHWVAELEDGLIPLEQKRALAVSEEIGDAVAASAQRPDEVASPERTVTVDSRLARCSAWYELFPRSFAAQESAHGTFRDCERVLEYVAAMGFDILYLPPIHPIGKEFRKGRNNSVQAAPGDVGSPWAIGSDEGGHKAIHPSLGTTDDFRHFRDAVKAHGLELALDIAFQCAPDHPYVREHPEWFLKRPDGTIQYAENPPKKYQDIYPFNFEGEDWQGLWSELKSVFDFWIGEGVRVFRVDNPHTKPFHFWEWAIGEIQREHPDVIFLSEAFTRPKVLHRLAKLGFSQSYNYFPWRNTKHEITEYLTELTQGPGREYLRPNLWPNTPDILPEYLQFDGQNAFVIRLILAATLGASYGIYGPAFEQGENTPRQPGAEEYLNSEKYEIRRWDLTLGNEIRQVIAQVNRIRKENLALQHDWSLRFHTVDNDQLICYSKQPVHPTDSEAEDAATMLMVVNLDPHHRQSGWIHLPPSDIGVAEDRPYQVHDLLTQARYLWQGERNYVELDPHSMPAHIFRIRRWVRNEAQFDYYM